MQTILDWMIAEKFASNIFQATHIANGLKLAALHHQPEAQKARVRLYRAWRDSQVFPKADTASCYLKAIAGETVPELPLLMVQAAE